MPGCHVLTQDYEGKSDVHDILETYKNAQILTMNFKQCTLHESWDFVYLSNDFQTVFSRFQGVSDLH